MPFLDQLLDPSITQGAQGGPTVTGRTKTYLPSGKLRQNFLASVPVHKYDVSHGIRTAAQRQAIIDLWYVVMFTPYSGFRFRDWSDYQATQSNTSCTLITGSVYQLNRVHTYGSVVVTRPIYKPVSGSVTVWRTRSGVVSAATASIDYTTGQTTISGHVAGDTYTWSGQFDVPVTFSDDAWVDTLQANVSNLAIDCGEIKLEELTDPASITT